MKTIITTLMMTLIMVCVSWAQGPPGGPPSGPTTTTRVKTFEAHWTYNRQSNGVDRPNYDLVNDVRRRLDKQKLAWLQTLAHDPLKHNVRVHEAGEYISELEEIPGTHGQPNGPLVKVRVEQTITVKYEYGDMLDTPDNTFDPILPAGGTTTNEIVFDNDNSASFLLLEEDLPAGTLDAEMAGHLISQTLSTAVKDWNLNHMPSYTALDNAYNASNGMSHQTHYLMDIEPTTSAIELLNQTPQLIQLNGENYWEFDIEYDATLNKVQWHWTDESYAFPTGGN